MGRLMGRMTLTGTSSATTLNKKVQALDEDSSRYLVGKIKIISQQEYLKKAYKPNKNIII
jgi:hypothetical protein